MKKNFNNRKLNARERFLYRKEFETLLKKAYKDQKVRISKDLLEQLLFEEVVLNRKKNIVIKLPIWSGEFLQNIDLSEVDFSNVSWAALYYIIKYKKYIGLENPIIKYLGDIDRNNNLGIHRVTLSKLLKIKNLEQIFDGKVNYSGTNANINLSNSFEALHLNMINVLGCNFRGCKIGFSTSLKNFNLKDCDFTDSTMRLPKVVSDANVSECNFENCDLSKTIFDITSMLSRNVNLNNLKNTNAELSYKNKSEIYLAIFKDMLLTGCYLDGEYIEKEVDQISPKRPGL